MMRLTIERRLAIAFFGALALLTVNAVISYRATRTLIRNEQSVTHTLQVLNELEATLTIVVDAETGERGYIISGDETFLDPYRAALDGINEQIKELKQLTAGNPNQQARLPLLERKIADRLDYLKRQIALRKSGDVEGVRQVIVSGAGKTLMDEIRKLIAEMEDDENELLKRRSGESEASARTVTLSFAIASLSAAASFALLYWLAIRGLAERRRSADSIRDQRELLHVTLSSIGDAVIATDINGRVTFLNSGAESLTGCNRVEAIGRPLEETFQIINAQTRQPAENPVARVLQEGSVVGLPNHTRLIARGGTELDSAADAVMGEAIRLQQVIWNLLSNAVKFTPKDGRVEIRLERDDSHAQVTVSDTGQGISPDFLPHVFDRF